MLEAATVASLIIIAITVTFLFQPQLPAVLADMAMPFHEACLHHGPESVHSQLYLAMVCGKNLSQSTLHFELRLTGLLHLLVVSGSHLRFLESLIQKLTRTEKWAQALTFFALLGFTLLSGAQPPVLRAFLAHLLVRTNSSCRFCWTNIQIITLSGFFSLPLCQGQIGFQSLLLSWTASLAVAVFETQTESGAAKRLTLGEKVWRSIRSHFTTYVTLIPILLPLSVPHPISILCNWLLGPLLGVVLFPASLLVFLFPLLTPAVDQIWSLATFLVARAAAIAPTGLQILSLPNGILWAYLIGFNALLLSFEILKNSPTLLFQSREQDE